MAKVVMENYDPQFAREDEGGDVMVCGFNFGDRVGPGAGCDLS